MGEYSDFPFSHFPPNTLNTNYPQDSTPDPATVNTHMKSGTSLVTILISIYIKHPLCTRALFKALYVCNLI